MRRFLVLQVDLSAHRTRYPLELAWRGSVRLMRCENGVRTIWTRDRDYRRFPAVEARDPFE